MYTYSADAESGLCDRHQQAEIGKFSEYQMNGANGQRVGVGDDRDPPHPPYPPSMLPYPPSNHRPCLVHNGGPPGPPSLGLGPPSCPAHGPRGPHGMSPHLGRANGFPPGHSNKYSGFSPERVI